MKEQRRFLKLGAVIVAAVLNLTSAIALTQTLLFRDWRLLNFPLSDRLPRLQGFLHIVSHKMVPWIIAAMVLSTILIFFSSVGSWKGKESGRITE